LLQIINILALFNQKCRNPKFCHFSIESGSTFQHRLERKRETRLSRVWGVVPNLVTSKGCNSSIATRFFKM